MLNCETHFLKYTSPFIYRGEMHLRVQKMGKLQDTKQLGGIRDGRGIVLVARLAFIGRDALTRVRITSRTVAQKHEPPNQKKQYTYLENQITDALS